MGAKTRKWHFLCLVIFCFGQGFANVQIFHPPLLSIKEPYVDHQSGSKLQVSCYGKYPLEWETPSFMGNPVNDSRISITTSVNMTQTVNKYESTLTIQDLDFSDTGNYTCYFEGTTDFSMASNVTSLYVFVNDPDHLFSPHPSIISGHLMLPVQQHRRALIPCLPTASTAAVTLWKTEGEEAERVALGPDVAFDPRFGFFIYYPTIYFNGFFQCRARQGAVAEAINLTLFYMADTYNAPRPYINTSDAQHPVVNGTFVLKCTVDVDPYTRVFIAWEYPNNRSENRINQTTPVSMWKTIRGYKFQEVSTTLIVSKAQTDDSGTYVCTVTDHAEKTGRAYANIYVYESQQPAHVNLSTDIDVTQPILCDAGEDVRFVVTVKAFPSVSDVRLFWEKNGRRLRSDNHYRMNRTNATAVLEIKHLTRYDAATYELHGVTKDTNSSLAILLEVKDAPMVSVKNALPIYKVGKEYHLECHAEGFPAPIVWWRWKPCANDGECSEDDHYGWKDVEPNSEFPNKENVTLEYSYDKGFSLVSNMHLATNRSGHYKCIASSTMGTDSKVIPFVATDAEDGFEISTTDRKPVDKDLVKLSCKVNTFNFSYIEWKWRPMYSVGDLKSLENTSDVHIIRDTSPHSHTAVLSFQPIHLNSSGEYECIAHSLKNNGTEVKHITIDVKEIRRPVLNSSNLVGNVVKSKPGALQEFYCYTDGVPFPLVLWKKDGKELDVTKMSGVEITENNQRLTIRRVLRRDAGFYQCMVENRGGVVKANATLVVHDDKDMLIGELTTGEIVAMVLFVLMAIILILIVSCLIKRLLVEKKQKKDMDFISHNLFERGDISLFNPNLPLENQIDLLPYKHSCEFPKERLKFGKTLGQGAFGRVVEAEAIGLVDGEATTTVAVKMLKEAANVEQRKALIAELKILIHIGRHLNIVNLLGAVTKNMVKGELYVIVEYCCYGNLRHFLLKHKKSFLDQLDHFTGKLDPRISTLPGSQFITIQENMATYSNMLGIGMDNPTYREQSLNYADLSHQVTTTDSGTGASVIGSSDRYLRNSTASDVEDSATFITTCDLICFAFQCARGMEYLAAKKLIHRDLAARNVLLAKDKVVKICDFGLAKDIYKYSNYVKKSNGLLPIKWMAIESIRDRVFTTKSDVWSFGVLLWELFTLGSNPYPGVEINEEFFKKLKNGYRMERPEWAPEKINQMMKNCWLDDPNERPDFSQLVESIGSLLESSVRKYYVELNTPYQAMNNELFPNNNDYLQMTGISKEEYTNMINLSEPKQDPPPFTNTYTNIIPSSNNPPMIPLDDLGESFDRKARRLSSDVFSEDDNRRNNTEVTYLNMNSSDERDVESDEFDSVFPEPKSPVHYENGYLVSVPLLNKPVRGDCNA